MPFDRIFIRHLTPLIWRRWPHESYKTLGEFASTELDSGRQALRCLQTTDLKQLVPFLFRMVGEEYDHFSLFRAVSIDLANTYQLEKLNPVEDILPSEPTRKDILEVFAYVYVGEMSVEKLFNVYLRIDISPKIKSVFRTILKDEEIHKTESLKLLKELAPKSWRLLILRARILMSWFGFKKTMQNVGQLWIYVWLVPVYLLCGFFVRNRALRTMNINKPELLAALKKAQHDLEREC